MKKREMRITSMGIPLLILVFINLCLVTFSVLSLQNAVTDEKMSRKAAEHTTAYYEAVNAVNRRLCADAKQYRKTGEREYQYTEPVGEQQQLFVRVRMTGEEKNVSYKILEWELQETGNWEKDNSLHVYDGTEIRKEK